MGATMGAAAGRLLSAAGLPVDPTVFALAGMAGTIAGTTGAVLTGVVMVSEMTGDFAVAIPLLLVAVVSSAVRELSVGETIYTGKLLRRGHWVPTGLQVATAGAVRARDIMEAQVRDDARETAPGAAVAADNSLVEVIGALEDREAAVVTDRGLRIGIVTREGVDAAVRELSGVSLFAKQARAGVES
jgi:hypothetical protein